MIDPKILVIEDNRLNLELVTDLLEANGFVVFSAQTAEEGLRMARELSPALVLMDFSLPGMDGLTATRKIKSDPATRHLGVIGLTAHAMRGDQEVALASGCDGYLTKPIDTSTFIESITRFMDDSHRYAKTIGSSGGNAVPGGATGIASASTRRDGVVLVVDDEEQNRTLLRDSLEARGYEVCEAENGAQALQEIAHRQPDVILLDVMMPGMTGFEVCRRIKQDSRTSHLPVLMITALSDRKERLMGIEAGANDFLNKPVDIQDVMLRVENARHSKRLHDNLCAEQARSERLLLNILPEPIAARMKNGESLIADVHSDASVLVAELIGFTSLASHIDAEQMVHLLNEIFSAFDDLVEDHRLEKIKTIGDTYVVGGGVFSRRHDHNEAVVQLAIAFREEMDRLNLLYGTSTRLRIGFSSGPVIGGIIGRNKFAYDIWGETVNVAWSLARSAQPGEVYVDETVFQRLKGKYQFVEADIDSTETNKRTAYCLEKEGSTLGQKRSLRSRNLCRS